MSDKEIKFTEKKVDESWKDQVNREKGTVGPRPRTQDNEPEKPNAVSKTSKPFVNLISSLGYQAMFHLGEIPNPDTQQPEVNLEAAKEIIDLLTAVKEKTEGNLSPEESEMLKGLLPELQLKFSQRA
jgi:hypothetical protein